VQASGSGRVRILLPRAGRLAALVVAGAVLAGCGSNRLPEAGQPSFYASLASANVEVDQAAAASMISGYRKNNGLGPVAIDPVLSRLAAEHSRAMARADRMEHTLTQPFTARLKAGGYDAVVAAENIGAGYHTLAEAFSGWRDSSGHRQNMLLKGATHMGIATAYSPKSKYKVFWTLILAAPDQKR